MTERHEVQGLMESLEAVKAEVQYEAATRPGEGAEVAQIFLCAVGKIEEAIALLAEADAIMGLQDRHDP